MKSVFSFFIITIIAAFSMKASARTITSFQDSDALMTVTAFMYDVAEDIPVSTGLTDKKVNLKDFSNCVDVAADTILSDVELGIKRVLRVYPDEEIPFEQALADLEDYLDHQSFKKCSSVTTSPQAHIESVYYVDHNDKIHLRMDNTSLLAE